MVQSAARMHARAVAMVNRGDYVRARQALATAAARRPDADTQARIQGTLAYVLAQTGQIDVAEAMCRAELERPSISGATVGVLAGQLGAFAQRRGDLEQAAAWLERGIDAFDSSTVERARLLMNRSLVNMQRLRLDDAASDAADAHEIYLAGDAPSEAAMAQHNLGYINLLRGNIAEALQEMYEARPLAGTTPVTTAVCDTDRAEALRDAGMTREAERLLASVAPIFGRHRMPQSRAEVEFQLARSQLTHDPMTAARTAATAARRFRAFGAETWAIRADGIRLRARLSRGSPRAVDPAEVERVATALADSGFANESTALRLSLDIWRSGRGMPQPAPVVRVPPTASIDVRLLGYEARAARAAAAGRDAVARRQAANGLDQLTAWQRAFGSLDLQTSVRMHAGGLMIAGLTAAARSGRADVLFEWSERGRHLSHQVVPVRPPEDPQLAADLAELRQRMSGDPTGRWRLDPHFAELEERAPARQWSATRGGGIRRRATLREVQARLDDGTALLSFVYTGAELAVIVVTGARARVVPLPGWAAAAKLLPGLRADLDMAASIRTRPMADVVRRSLDDRLASLSASLLDEAVRVSRAERFVLTVPGVLEGTPWAMLPALRGRTFTVAVSATRWSGFERDVPVGGRVGIAVGPRVARGEEEADAVAAAWTGASDAPGAQLRGTDATVDAVTALAGRVDLLHVAAHGRHAVDNPLFSGFEMADGALFGYDLDRVPDVPGVVVLSACEAGRSSVRWGEEAVGMTRVWMHAGTRAVVAAPVIVADDAACDLLGAMHAGLAAGLGVSAALARAGAETGIVAPFQVYGSGF